MEVIKKEKPLYNQFLGLRIKMDWYNFIKDTDTKFGVGKPEIVTLKDDEGYSVKCLKIRDAYFQPSGFTWEKLDTEQGRNFSLWDPDEEHTKMVNRVLDALNDFGQMRVGFEMDYDSLSFDPDDLEVFGG